MEWGSVTGSWQLSDQPPVWDWPPVTGELPGTVTMTVAALLARYAAPDRPWFFGLWQGHGRLTFPGMAATFDLPQRPMFLFEGDLASLTTFAKWAGAGPNLWWPAGREWCVGTDIDLMTTYGGASAGCIKALFGDDAIEAREVSADQSVAWDSDTVNPLPSPPS